MIELDISHFSGSYASLNGNAQPFSVSKFDIGRAIITIGYLSIFRAFRQTNFFRILELLSKPLAYFEVLNNSLVLNSTFHGLEKTEKVINSFYFGQAFTKLFAENKLKCIWVDNVQNQTANIIYNMSNVSFTPKLKLNSTNDAGSEPDLIGFGTNNNFHVMEAKGYSSGYNVTEHQKAINQVSRVTTVNGISPDTRDACFFDLSGNPIKGNIIDPENNESLFNIEFKVNDFLSSYYSIFNFDLEKLDRPLWKLKANNYEFLVFQIGYPYIFLGVYLELYENVIKNDTFQYIGEILPLEIKILEFPNIIDYSLGRDGILLIQLKSNSNLGIFANRTIF